MTQDLQKMWMTEFRPRMFRTASEGIVENLEGRYRKLRNEPVGSEAG
jgi:hypothetical protein